MNNKGFTLVELIVSIAILGLITAISIPTLNVVQSSMEKKQFVSYGDGLISSAKIYTDSYNEDMFTTDNVYQLSYSEMNKKGLVKDIGIDNVSCNNENTYVLVAQNGNSYVYCLNMSCKSTTGEEVFDSKDSEYGTSTGLCKKIKYYKVTIDCNNETKTNTFKLLHGTKYNLDYKRCSKLGYYLDKYEVIDDSGTVVNKITSSQTVTIDKNMTIKAHYIDITPPEVTVKVYKRDSNGNKTGDVLKTYKSSGKNTITINSTDYPNKVNNWLNDANYPYGVYFEFSYSDVSGIASVQQLWNDTGKTSYVSLTKSGPITYNPSSPSSIALSGEGKRYSTYTIKDNANNATTVSIYVDMDRTVPSVKTYDKWQNRALVNLNDTLSGATYLVSTKNNLTSSASGFKSIANNSDTYTDDLTVDTTNGTKYYLYIKDNAGNFSFTRKSTTISPNKYLLVSGKSKTANSTGTETYNWSCWDQCYISYNSNNIFFSAQANKSLSFNELITTKNYRYAYIYVYFKRNVTYGPESALSIHFYSTVKFNGNFGIPEASASGDTADWFYRYSDYTSDLYTEHKEKVLIDLWNKKTNYNVIIHNCDTDVYWYDVYLTNLKPSGITMTRNI